MAVDTQVPPQLTCPGGHGGGTHTPPMHWLAPVQAGTQAGGLLTQMPATQFWSGPQAGTQTGGGGVVVQTPATHALPSPHLMPQAPQLNGLVMKFVSCRSPRSVVCPALTAIGPLLSGGGPSR